MVKGDYFLKEKILWVHTGKDSYYIPSNDIMWASTYCAYPGTQRKHWKSPSGVSKALGQATQFLLEESFHLA